MRRNRPSKAGAITMIWPPPMSICVHLDAGAEYQIAPGKHDHSDQTDEYRRAVPSEQRVQHGDASSLVVLCC